MQFQLLMRFTDGPQPDPKPSQSALRGQQVFGDDRLRAVPHADDADRAGDEQRGAAEPAGEPVLRPAACTTWVQASPTTSSRAPPARTSSARTPLWGVGQRIFFLHDGRTNDLMEAISAHASQGSEANAVISSFNNLATSDKQAILNFLRSL